MTNKSDYPRTLHKSQIFVAFSIILAIVSPFSTYSPWKFGPWPAVEFPIILSHAAALCAVAMVIDSRRSIADVVESLWSAPVLICTGIAVWSAAMVPFTQFPWLSIIRTPQTADGTVLWLDMAILVATVRLCANRPSPGQPTTTNNKKLGSV
jgi:hypothetical protein